MNFGLPEHILNAIIKELQKHNNVTRSLIFGSRAIGKDLNIDFSKKFMKLKEIKKVLGETKKGDFSL